VLRRGNHTTDSVQCQDFRPSPFVPRTGVKRGTVRRPAVTWDGWPKASVRLNGGKTACLYGFLCVRRHHFPFRCRNPSRRRTRLQSTFATGKSLSKERRTRFDFVRRRWLRRFFRRRSFCLPVTLNRFAVALCVFILGIILSNRSPSASRKSVPNKHSLYIALAWLNVAAAPAAAGQSPRRAV